MFVFWEFQHPSNVQISQSRPYRDFTDVCRIFVVSVTRKQTLSSPTGLEHLRARRGRTDY